MDLDAWKIVDVTAWEPDAPNPVGRREKQWLIDPSGRRWLFKVPLDRRPTEPPIEAFTARLARAVGLDAPETHVGIRDGRRATLVRTFLADGEKLTHGSVLLQTEDDAYDPGKHEMHRLDRIRAVLSKRSIEPANFVGLLAFDFWVGNSDRHHIKRIGARSSPIRAFGLPLRSTPRRVSARSWVTSNSPIGDMVNQGASMSMAARRGLETARK